MTTPTPDELARAIYSQLGGGTGDYHDAARAILPIVNARLDAVTKERDELRAKTLKVENCILCADECRGHSLGDSAAWEPEEGSRDWLNFQLAAAREKLARVEGALEDIGIYGCGMLNQPAAMNGPEHLWLEKRIHRMEQVARDTLAALREPAAEEGRG